MTKTPLSLGKWFVTIIASGFSEKVDSIPTRGFEVLLRYFFSHYQTIRTWLVKCSGFQFFTYIRTFEDVNLNIKTKTAAQKLGCTHMIYKVSLKDLFELRCLEWK